MFIYQTWKGSRVDGFAKSTKIKFGLKADTHDSVFVEVMETEVTNLATRDYDFDASCCDGSDFFF